MIQYAKFYHFPSTLTRKNEPGHSKGFFLRKEEEEEEEEEERKKQNVDSSPNRGEASTDASQFLRFIENLEKTEN